MCIHDDGEIFRAMQQAAESGTMIMMHAENGIAIDVLVAQALARGETDPMYHSLTRPAELEAEATHRAIELSKVAGNVPLYVVHMSASGALEEVAAAQQKLIRWRAVRVERSRTGGGGKRRQEGNV